MSQAVSLIIHTDGGSRSNPGPAAIGICVEDSAKNVVHEAHRYLGIATNNEAEYEAFLASLQWLSEFLKSNQVAQVTWQLDSKLVVEQLNRHWKIKEDRLRTKAMAAWQVLDALPCPYRIEHVLRHLNKRADELVNQALDAQVNA